MWIQYRPVAWPHAVFSECISSSLQDRERKMERDVATFEELGAKAIRTARREAVTKQNEVGNAYIRIDVAGIFTPGKRVIRGGGGKDAYRRCTHSEKNSRVFFTVHGAVFGNRKSYGLVRCGFKKRKS